MRQQRHGELPLRVDPERPAGEAGVAERGRRERPPRRAGAAPPRPTQRVVALGTSDSVRDPVRREQCSRAQPRFRERGESAGGEKEPGVTGEPPEPARVAVLRHAGESALATREPEPAGCRQSHLATAVERTVDRTGARWSLGRLALDPQRADDLTPEQRPEPLTGRPLREEPPEEIAEIAVRPGGRAQRRLGGEPGEPGFRGVGRAWTELLHRVPGDESGAVSQQALERSARERRAGGGQQVADRGIERQRAPFVETERERGDEGLGQGRRVEEVGRPDRSRRPQPPETGLGSRHRSSPARDREGGGRPAPAGGERGEPGLRLERRVRHPRPRPPFVPSLDRQPALSYRGDRSPADNDKTDSVPDANAPLPPTASAAGGLEPPRALVGEGPLATEALLIAELERALPPGAGLLERLAAPVRVVVPSGALRAHLLARLARHRPAWLGLEVVTLRGLALAIVERAGETPPRGAALLPVLVRRGALRQPELARLLEPLEGGFAPLVGTVRDLLDAGIEGAHEAGLSELLASDEVSLGGAERARAQAVVRVAAEIAETLEALDRLAGAALYRHAAELLEQRPEALPPARELFVHGFADATGAVSELLRSVTRRLAAAVFLDLPRSAAGAPRDPIGEPFGTALRERLLGGRPPDAIAPAGAVGYEAFSALGETAEAREIARRVRSALRSGVAPEAIGVVARDLAPHLAPLRRAFEDAAIPYSVEGAAPAPAELRAALAVVRLLDEREAVRADLVLDLLAPGLAEVAPAAELRVAARLLGAATLGDLATLDLGVKLGTHATLPLPVRGLSAEGEEGEPVERPRARRLARAAIARFLAAARALARAVADLPERAPARSHLGALGALAHSVLPATGPAGPWLAGALARLAAGLPADFELGRDEVAELLARAAEGIDRQAPGGRGGGVQILSVVAARGRTFDRLYLAGLNRGVFPRPAVEDPFLPDAARRALRTLLPDLPVKGDGPFEERFLFDQLANAAPVVTFSFPSRADDASTQLVSPLLDRFSWRDEATRALRRGWQHPVPPSAGVEVDATPAPGDEAVRAGLAGDRERWRLWLAATLAEDGGREATGSSDEEVAAARAETLAEIDPDPVRDPAGARLWRQLGPFFGRVGRATMPSAPLFVTRVEQTLACGWKTFLERGLGLEPLADPLRDLPSLLDPRLVGTGAHRLLESLLRDPGEAPRRPLGELLGIRGRRLAFPDPTRVGEVARGLAAELLAEEGLAPWGFERLLAAAMARAALAAKADWHEGPVEVLGVEVDGETSLDRWGVPVALAFRADRVDRDGERIRLTDYKSWTPRRLKARTRGDKWLANLRRGVDLQPAAYVASLGGASASGRFFAVGDADDGDDEERIATLDESSETELAAFAETVRRAAAALEAGRLPPRLVDPSGFDSGPACRWCEVAEACLQGDSGARRRLRDWTADRRTDGPGAAADDRAEVELVLAHDPVEPAG